MSVVLHQPIVDEEADTGCYRQFKDLIIQAVLLAKTLPTEEHLQAWMLFHSCKQLLLQFFSSSGLLLERAQGTQYHEDDLTDPAQAYTCSKKPDADKKLVTKVDVRGSETAKTKDSRQPARKRGRPRKHPVQPATKGISDNKVITPDVISKTNSHKEFDFKNSSSIGCEQQQLDDSPTLVHVPGDVSTDDGLVCGSSCITETSSSGAVNVMDSKSSKKDVSFCSAESLPKSGFKHVENACMRDESKDGKLQVSDTGHSDVPVNDITLVPNTVSSKEDTSLQTQENQTRKSNRQRRKTSKDIWFFIPKKTNQRCAAKDKKNEPSSESVKFKDRTVKEKRKEPNSKSVRLKEKTVREKKVTTVESLTCKLCGRVLGNASNLRVHMRSHSGEKPHKCGFCEKSFSTITNRRRHERGHKGERPYKCSICEKSFTEKKTLTIHERIHTGERPYSCPVCQKTFSHPSALTMHKLVHGQVKSHLCELCGTSFTQRSQLVVHRKRHHNPDRPPPRTRRKMHECQTCHNKFPDKLTLLLHEVGHQEEPPYSCKLCVKAFSVKQHLTEHLKQNHKALRYTCTVCSTSFPSHAIYLKHQDLHRQEQETENVAPSLYQVMVPAENTDTVTASQLLPTASLLAATEIKSEDPGDFVDQAKIFEADYDKLNLTSDTIRMAAVQAGLQVGKKGLVIGATDLVSAEKLQLDSASVGNLSTVDVSSCLMKPESLAQSGYTINSGITTKIETANIFNKSSCQYEESANSAVPTAANTKEPPLTSSKTLEKLLTSSLHPMSVQKSYSINSSTDSVTSSKDHSSLNIHQKHMLPSNKGATHIFISDISGVRSSGNKKQTFSAVEDISTNAGYPEIVFNTPHRYKSFVQEQDPTADTILSDSVSMDGSQTVVCESALSHTNSFEESSRNAVALTYTPESSEICTTFQFQPDITETLSTGETTTVADPSEAYGSSFTVMPIETSGSVQYAIITMEGPT